jgi:hypothetical protein
MRRRRKKGRAIEGAASSLGRKRPGRADTSATPHVYNLRCDAQSIKRKNVRKRKNVENLKNVSLETIYYRYHIVAGA